MEAFSFRFIFYMGFPGSSVGKESTCNAGVAGDEGLIPGSGSGHGNLLHYSCLENSMDRGAWWAIVHRVACMLARMHLLYEICDC